MEDARMGRTRSPEREEKTGTNVGGKTLAICHIQYRQGR